MKKNHDIIEITALIKHETEKAVLVENLKGKDVWLPKSQCDVEGKYIQLPDWLATDKELI